MGKNEESKVIYLQRILAVISIIIAAIGAGIQFGYAIGLIVGGVALFIFTVV